MPCHRRSFLLFTWHKDCTYGDDLLHLCPNTARWVMSCESNGYRLGSSWYDATLSSSCCRLSCWHPFFPRWSLTVIPVTSFSSGLYPNVPLPTPRMLAKASLTRGWARQTHQSWRCFSSVFLLFTSLCTVCFCRQAVCKSQSLMPHSFTNHWKGSSTLPRPILSKQFLYMCTVLQCGGSSRPLRCGSITPN